MAPRSRATNLALIKRQEQIQTLLDKNYRTGEVVQVLMHTFGISESQAFKDVAKVRQQRTVDLSTADPLSLLAEEMNKFNHLHRLALQQSDPDLDQANRSLENHHKVVKEYLNMQRKSDGNDSHTPDADTLSDGLKKFFEDAE
jgi:molybdopterin-biosynthesis enzyme MoeA-like protein